MKVLAALVVALVALAGCSSGSSKKSASPTTTATTAPETTVGAGAPKSTTGGGATTIGPTTTRPPDLTLTNFKTPSGNIGCIVGTTGFRCDINQYTYTPSPKPTNCQLDWGSAVVFDHGSANFDCHGDTIMDPSMQTLPYGQRTRQGSFVCDSEQAGVTCTDEASGHGAFLSRDSYRFF